MKKNFLWNSKTGVQSIGTAFGSERVAGVSGGIHFELGGKEVRVEEGVHSRKDLPYSLIGTGIMNRAGLIIVSRREGDRVGCQEAGCYWLADIL